MGELAVLSGILIAIVLIFVVLLFYKDGVFVKSKIGILLTSAFVVLLTLLVFTSFPSNYIIQRGLSILIGILGIIGYSILVYNKEKLNLGRILLLISIIGNLLVLYIA